MTPALADPDLPAYVVERAWVDLCRADRHDRTHHTVPTATADGSD